MKIEQKCTQVKGKHARCCISEMIDKLQGANRRFDVIGFAEFQRKHEQNEWLKKVDNLFSSLDVSVDDRFDTRVSQLKELFQVLVDLIEAYRFSLKSKRQSRKQV